MKTDLINKFGAEGTLHKLQDEISAKLDICPNPEEIPDAQFWHDQLYDALTKARAAAQQYDAAIRHRGLSVGRYI